MTLLPLVLALSVTANPEDPAAKPDKDPRLDAVLRTFRQEFVELTPGKGRYPASLMMGSDTGPADQRPRHKVTFGYSFAVAKYEVPQNLWEAVMGDNPSRWTGDRNSVEMLSFEQAIQFCQKATRQMRQRKLIDADQEIRLPTEAEWEYAARAGTDTAYSFGDDLGDLDAHAWHTGNASGNDPPVGALKPNPWGLYDMHGYLWEWCLDVGSKNYTGAPADGSPRVKGDAALRVIRGGSWKDAAKLLESRCRGGQFRTKFGDRGVIRFSGGVDKRLLDDAVGLRCVLAKTRP